MRRLLSATVVFLLFVGFSTLHAQRENDHWYFGSGAALDFRGGAPVVLTNSAMDQWEGCATVSDNQTGQLLFYTDGVSVWNRNHRIMPNGTGLLGNVSSTQSVMVVPMPRDSQKYYIFTAGVGDYVPEAPKGIYYSILDMTLDGGRGDIVAQTKNVEMVGSAVEKLTAVKHCNGRAFWVIGHEVYSNTFLSFLVDYTGVSTAPVRSSTGSYNGTSVQGGIGYLKAAPSGRRLAAAVLDLGIVDIADFDPKTGQVSNAITLQVDESTYGVCFSPDETKLYVSGELSAYVCQYDISSGDVATISATKTILHSTAPEIDLRYYYGAIQLGPDGKVYVSHKGDYLGVVNNPNAPGTACGYVHDALFLQGNYNGLGLPNIVEGIYDEDLEYCRPPTAVFAISDTFICAGECIEFTDMSYDNPDRWEWTFQGGTPGSFSGRQPPTVCYPNPGDFDVRLIVSNDNGADTMMRIVRVRPVPSISVSPDTSICGPGASAQLRAVGGSNLTWSWSPARGLSCTDCPNPIARPTVKTTYTVTATTPDGCIATDEVTVTPSTIPDIVTGPDLMICQGSEVMLSVSGGVSYRWDPATDLSCTDCPNPVATPMKTTTYRVVGAGPGGCESFDEVTVTVLPRPQLTVDPNLEICLGDEVMLGATGQGRLHWSPARGLSCTDCPNPMASPTETTTYYVTVEGSPGCPEVDSVRVWVNPAPRTVNAHIERNYRAYPGEKVMAPVILDNTLEKANISSFTFTLRYDPGMIHLKRAFLDSTIADGWQLLPITNNPSQGLYIARIFSLPQRALTGTGDLIRLEFLSFIGTSLESKIDFDIDLADAPCTIVETDPGLVQIDSVCGLNFRLVEAFSSKYSLDDNTPNPFNPVTEISFSLGLDGPTTLEIFDASGRHVATLVDEILQPGSYSVRWDASAYPSGLYYYRLHSGHWQQTRQMMLVK
jgi:PKD repeat protein